MVVGNTELPRLAAQQYLVVLLCPPQPTDSGPAARRRSLQASFSACCLWAWCARQRREAAAWVSADPSSRSWCVQRGSRWGHLAVAGPRDRQAGEERPYFSAPLQGFVYFATYAGIVTASAIAADSVLNEGHALRVAAYALGWSATGLYALTFFLSAATAKSTLRGGEPSVCCCCRLWRCGEEWRRGVGIGAGVTAVVDPTAFSACCHQKQLTYWPRC